MDFPEELKYSKEHVWVRIERGTAVIGITDFAQEELGLVNGVELPDEGDEVEQDDSVGSIEARKTVAEIYAPFSGTVQSVNHEVLDNPDLVNDDPYDGGWLVEITLDDPDELKSLMSADDYADYIENRD
ncbi:MAG: glycine cleavage system protein H [Geobacteraceae bacterium GWC2_55_20]|nr:MAG: glycine cleavage system protein H [Geobacteraceae bacterium GWC2_55_20]OGU23200.1 MAG: glycine cleavage system protein H [Geobacteraceae bacterium GWF2_54_21]HBA70660.1 glycine cleavage system protein GcvH [Geobacter sp.]HCE69026.1 glycine cleavage system protein GcvH [Geobacter sp.]